MSSPDTQPITLEPRSVERIWGQEVLHAWYPQPEHGRPIGEVWLTAAECVVEGTTSTLADVVRQAPAAFGDASRSGFPLLLKLLYPREKLSVQVHPNDEEALATLGEPRGKTECWYVLSAEPGASVAVGFRSPLSAEDMRSAINDGTLEEKLCHIPVKAGDMVFVDAGTVHAIGPGMVVLETQQYSDTTYRLWDYGRPRELHLDAGLAVARGETAAGLVESQQMDGFRRLITCRYFTVDSFRAQEERCHELEEDVMQILIALGAGANLRFHGQTFALQPGRAVILPKGMTPVQVEIPAGLEVVRVF